jgi:hypothetical protein
MRRTLSIVTSLLLLVVVISVVIVDSLFLGILS